MKKFLISILVVGCGFAVLTAASTYYEDDLEDFDDGLISQGTVSSSKVASDVYSMVEGLIQDGYLMPGPALFDPKPQKGFVPPFCQRVCSRSRNRPECLRKCAASVAQCVKKCRTSRDGACVKRCAENTPFS